MSEMERFGGLLSGSLDVTIRQIFGDSASELIYSLMERQVHLKREEAGKNLEAFHAYVSRLVGSEIAQIILAGSLKRLCAEVEREYEQVESYFSLLDTLFEIKFKLLTSSSNEKCPVHN
jgi:hypothetical protein